MSRILISPKDVHSDRIVITEEEAVHHLRRVLRLRRGEQVECTDGAGSVFTGAVEGVGPQAVTVTVASRRQEPEPSVSVVLAQALISPERFAWALQKAAELGAARIIPMTTARTAVPDGRMGAARRSRWQRIIRSAVAQSGRSRVPALEAPRTFRDVLDAVRGDALLFSAAAPGRPVAQALEELPTRGQVTVLIGPEGDFAPEELAAAARKRIMPVTLGPAVLRAETAALVALSLVQSRVGGFNSAPAADV